MPDTYRRIRRTEITLERERRIRIGPGSGPATTCPLCDGTPMLEPAIVAGIVGIGTRALYRALERGLLHFHEPGEAPLTVCLRSAEGLITTESKERER